MTTNMKQSEKIDELTKLVEKLISREVAPVLPIAPIAPVAPILPITPINSGDHDEIVKLVVTVGNIEKKVDTLQGTMDGELVGVKKDVEIIKLWKSNLIGKLSILTAVISIAVTLIGVWAAKHFGI